MALKLYDKAMHALRYWLLHKLPTCQKMVSVMSQSLERPLNLRERIELKLHLWVCIWCVWYLEHLHLMRDTLRNRASRVTDGEASSGIPLSTEARERIKRALKAGNQ